MPSRGGRATPGAALAFLDLVTLIKTNEAIVVRKMIGYNPVNRRLSKLVIVDQCYVGLGAKLIGNFWHAPTACNWPCIGGAPTNLEKQPSMLSE